ncbi:hypothetical protein GPA26_07755 [Aromatoleum petrolei]|uniref:O-antigen ligase family protein n=1 Tax=Aromatoleum petrolei TaxID=76116 RepID=A0ABX1MTC3_9RHOO|nr:hypothetical protein [Aromatoleum petrolei]
MRDGRAGYWLGSVILFVFCASFYAPISSKASNNIFYAGLGLPALTWWLYRPRVALDLFRVAPAFSVVYALLAAWLSLVDIAFLKDSSYLAVLFLCCAMLDRRGRGVVAAFGAFALVSAGMFAYAVFDWIRLLDTLDVWPRVALWGQGQNPVYAALLMASSFTFLWLFYVERRLASRPRWLFWGAFALLTALCGMCAIVFQARSALIGFAAFFAAYLVQRRLVYAGLIVAAAALATLSFSGLDGTLLERGLSFRLDIWLDALRRLSSDCSIWVGCGKDDYRFLGQFFHAHSAYVSILYEGGAIALALFLALAAVFFVTTWRSRSRWMLVALVGWAGVATTTPGVIVSPRTLWVFFWIPTLMAVLDSGRPALESYYRARDAVSRRG